MKKIGVFGSCVSRDAFNSNFVHNYKDFFEVIISAQRISMISIFQDSFTIDEDLIKISPYSQENNARTKMLLFDLNRNFLKQILERKIDYLIIDNYLEVTMGILYFDNTIITNNTWDLCRTKFYKHLKNKFEFSIIDYPEEYFFLWSKYCDLFFKFLKKYCPNVKVVLNKGRVIDKVIENDGSIYTNHELKKMAELINPILDRLDSYIQKNFNVEVIDFDFENTFGDENHMWGMGPVHYTNNYYPTLISKLLDIVNNNELKDKPVKNNKISLKFKQEVHLLNLESKLYISNIMYETLRVKCQKNERELNLIKDDENSSLAIYKTGRVDLKNFGSYQNSLKIIEISDSESKYEHPPWFKSQEGKGLVIESKKGWIDLKIKCICDGKLKIWLRGPDVKDQNGVNFPVYIHYTHFSINGKLCLEAPKLVWHNTPISFEMPVSDSDILDIHIEWNPFNKNSIYVQ